MNIYASTFISGLQEPVSHALLQHIPDAHIISLYDGLVLYGSGMDVQKIAGLHFFNNSFIVLKRFENLPHSPFEYMLRKVAGMSDAIKKLDKKILSGKRTFRIVASNQNKLVAVNNGLLRKIESLVSNASGLTVDRLSPDTEFWLLYRSEKTGYFMLRITRHTLCGKPLKKGELRPELSYMLNFISEPHTEDTFIDPFSGFGSIAAARSLLKPASITFACDIDEEKVGALKRRFGKYKKGMPVFVKRMDALDMRQFKDGFFDKIVTDPPWGLYNHVGMDIEVFYSRMMEEFHRVLKPGGIAVILTAGKTELEGALPKFKGRLVLCSKYDILVSGKKAAVYKLAKARWADIY